jgi:proline dehydrogenase
VIGRIDEICKNAAERNVMVLIDAEETWIIEPCNELTEAMMEKYNRKQVIVFNTYQFYCHGTLPFLKYSIEEASKKGYLLGAKLVRGAYMEKERARAAAMNYQDPIQPDKESTDRDYDAGVLLCLQNLDKLALFIGTHNEKSCATAVEYMERNGIEPKNPRVFFSQLYGMSDNISFNIANAGYHVSKYLPYGPVKDVIPYLMRRAQENTSVAGQTSRELLLIQKEMKRRKLM